MKTFSINYTRGNDVGVALFTHETKNIDDLKKDVEALISRYSKKLNNSNAKTRAEFVMKKLPKLGYVDFLPESITFFDTDGGVMSIVLRGDESKKRSKGALG